MSDNNDFLTDEATQKEFEERFKKEEAYKEFKETQKRKENWKASKRFFIIDGVLIITFIIFHLNKGKPILRILPMAAFLFVSLYILYLIIRGFGNFVDDFKKE